MPEPEQPEDHEPSFSGRELAQQLVGQPAEGEPRPQDAVESFVTSHGSLYTYDESGRTTRFKTATGELQPTQDLTVFVDLGPRDFGDALRGFMTVNPRSKSEVHIIEDSGDGSPRVVENVDDIKQPANLSLTLYSKGQAVGSRPVSLFPRVESYVYDQRTFDESGKKRTERHLGHKVTSINYRQ